MRKSISSSLFALRVLAGLVLTAAGCSPLLSPPSVVVPNTGGSAALAISTAAAPQASGFPRGRFRAVSAANLLVISIQNNGDYSVFLDNDRADTGRFTVTETGVFVDSERCSREGYRAAAYAWSYDEENGLSFASVSSDWCPTRRQYLSEEFEPQYLFIYQIPKSGFPG